jgi:mannose-1-phosphate guanylyltransferase
MDDFFAVIMAGGGGTRLWPLSRENRPKQSLAILDKRPLFRVAVDRIKPLVPVDRILVVTVENQAGQLQKIAPELNAGNYLIEPSPRGTASVVGLAASYLEQIQPGSVMVVLTADHFMKNEDQFRKFLSVGYKIAENGELVTLGITPTYASTGYGYIQRGEKVGQVDGLPYFASLGFKEKPPEDTAIAYLRSGEYYWNSGMFIWRASRILEEIGGFMPDLAKGLGIIQDAFQSPEFEQVLAEEWTKLKAETIDYGIMEKAERVVVLPADDLGWIDIGSWDRMFEIMESDESGNIVLSKTSVVIDSYRSLVLSDESQARDRLVALLGVEDLVLVDTGDVILVCHRDRAEEVRKIVKMLSDQGMDSYL